MVFVRKFEWPTIFSIVGCVTPPVSLISPNALTPLLIVAAAGVLLAGPTRKILLAARGPSLVVLGLISVLGLLSSQWSIVPGHSLTKAAQLVPIFAAGLVFSVAGRWLTPTERGIIARSLVIGIMVATAFVVIERMTGGPVNYLLSGEPFFSSRNFIRYKRGAVVIALLLWPAVYGLHHRFGWVQALTGGLLVLAGLALLESGTVAVALAAGGAVALGTLVAPRIAPAVVAVILMSAFLAAPFVDYGWPASSGLVTRMLGGLGILIQSSAEHRFEIWKFVSERIWDHPLLGWGLDSSRAIPGGQDTVALYGSRLPLHPHNAALQIWLELGVVGISLAVLLIARLATAIHETVNPALMRAVALGAMTTTGVVALAGFGIWQSWWLATIWLVVALTAATLPSAHPSSD